MTSSLPFSGMTQEQWVEFVEDVEAALDKLANESVDVETQGFGLLTMAVMTLCAANHPRAMILHNVGAMYDALFPVMMKGREELGMGMPIVTFPGGDA